MATSCIFLCCRGDRELFLPREREVEVSSFGSLLKRKDMAKKKGPDQRRSEDGEAVFIQRLSPERGRRRGEKMWITVCFSSAREWPVIQSSQHHGIGSTREADIAPPESCRGPLGGQEKDSRFAIQAFRSPLRGRCARGRAASHSQGAIA